VSGVIDALMSVVAAAVARDLLPPSSSRKSPGLATSVRYLPTAVGGIE